MNIGFVGLGNMGAPMARRLIEHGFDVRVYDKERMAASAFSEHAVAELSELGRSTDILMTMLPNGQVVRDVLLGNMGAVRDARPGLIVVDMSSSDAAGTKALGAELARRGIMMVDAPVSGGVPLARQGKLLIMTGSDDAAALERIRPVLNVLGSRQIHVGALGAGHAAKTINNVIAAATIAATAEGLVLGQRFGIELGTLLDVINHSTGRSQASEGLFPGQVMTRKFALGFSLGLMSKDVRLAQQLAKLLRLDLPLLETTGRAWKHACDILGETTDFSAYITSVETANAENAEGVDV